MNRDEFYTAFKHDIITSKLKPGELLKEKQIMQDYGIGRLPMREIMVRLQQENLIETIPRMGTEMCIRDRPQNHGVPVPSTIRALQKSVSNMGCLAERRGNGPERRGEPPILSVRPAGNYGVGPCGGCLLYTSRSARCG